METATAATEDLSSSSTSASTSTSAGNTTAERWIYALWRHHQHLMDRFVPYVKYRWIAVLVIAFIYFVRVLWLQGFHVVTYAVGIYVLNLLIGFLSPQVDPEIQNGPVLPIRGSDEFRPFVRRVPEFKFWLSVTHAFLIAFVMTFFPVFDVPVFWPILLFYWVVLFTATMRRQITHMIKYKYVPFTFGKQRYGKKAAAPSAETAELLRA